MKTTPMKYKTPALEKGLNILEVLAQEPDGLTQAEIAERLGQSVSEIYRMLYCLQERSYIQKKTDSEKYCLTLKLFEIAHHYPPTKHLIDSALPEMRLLAEEIHQSCHLVVLHHNHVLVLAVAENPDIMGFSVRTGILCPIETSASGRVLLAHQPEKVKEKILNNIGIKKRSTKWKKLISHLEKICNNGYECAESDVIQGIVDISYPVIDRTGVVAAISVPCMISKGKQMSIESTQKRVERCSNIINEKICGKV